MILEYLYSEILPCYCEGARMIERGENLCVVKIQNPKKLIDGYIIERRYELDEDSKIHIETCVLCKECLAGRRLH